MIEESRRITQRQKIIHMLREAGNEGCTNIELSKISLRYGAHLGELYTKGYRIKKVYLDGGVFKYFLVSVPGDIKHFKNAQEEVLNDIEEYYDDAIQSSQLEVLLEEKHFHIIRKPGWYEQQFLN